MNAVSLSIIQGEKRTQRVRGGVAGVITTWVTQNGRRRKQIDVTWNPQDTTVIIQRRYEGGEKCRCCSLLLSVLWEDQSGSLLLIVPALQGVLFLQRNQIDCWRMTARPSSVRPSTALSMWIVESTTYYWLIVEYITAVELQLQIEMVSPSGQGWVDRVRRR